MDNTQGVNYHLKSATLTMLLVSILIFWIPVFGAFIAGVAGGKKARTINIAMLSAIIPAVVFGIFLYTLSTSLTALPVFGIIARQGKIYLPLIYLISIILGAWFGGAIGEKV